MNGQPPDWQPPEGQPPEGRPPYTPKSGWQIAGIGLAVVAAIGGLVMLGLVLAFFVAISQFGSNK